MSSIAPALGKIPSGLFILTSRLDNGMVGMLASFVEQAGFDPPMVTLAVQPGRVLQKALEESKLVGINILSEGNGSLMRPFSQSNVEHPFEELELVENEHRLPQLAQAMAFLAAKIQGRIEAGDHIVYTAEVIDGTLQHPDADPMVRIRKNGLSY